MPKNYREQMVQFGQEAHKEYKKMLASPEERLRTIFDIVQGYVKSVKKKEPVDLVTPCFSDRDLRFHGTNERIDNPERDVISLGIEKRNALDGAHHHEEMVIVGVEGTIHVDETSSETITQQFLIEPSGQQLFLHGATSYDKTWERVDDYEHGDPKGYVKFVESLVHTAIPHHGGPDTG